MRGHFGLRPRPPPRCTRSCDSEHPVAEPAYTRMHVDDRRRQLLIAREVGISKEHDLLPHPRRARRGRPPPPKMRTAANAWLWFMDGAILDWLEHRDMTRTELRDLLLGSLAGSLTAAGWSL